MSDSSKPVSRRDFFASAGSSGAVLGASLLLSGPRALAARLTPEKGTGGHPAVPERWQNAFYPSANSSTVSLRLS